MKIHLVKKDFALYPAEDTDAEKLLKLKRGDVLSCEIKQARNYRFFTQIFCPDKSHVGIPHRARAEKV